jgi:hypothetical protein
MTGPTRLFERRQQREEREAIERTRKVGSRVGAILHGESPELVLNVLFAIAKHVCEENGTTLRTVFDDFIEQDMRRGGKANERLQ